MEQRKKDRRVNKKAIVVPERRTGFDRRSDNHTVGHKVAHHLSSNMSLLACLLILINLLNFADLIFTYLALGAGHDEANPFLRYIFINFSPLIGGYLKLGVGFIVTLAIWHLRKYRRMLEATLLILAIYTGIFFYHLFITLRYI